MIALAFLYRLAPKCTSWPKTSRVDCMGPIRPHYVEIIVIFSNDLRIVIVIPVRKALFEPHVGDYKVVMVNFKPENHRLKVLWH